MCMCVHMCMFRVQLNRQVCGLVTAVRKEKDSNYIIIVFMLLAAETASSLKPEEAPGTGFYCNCHKVCLLLLWGELLSLGLQFL